jgi:hypothetical protein
MPARCAYELCWFLFLFFLAFSDIFSFNITQVLQRETSAIIMYRAVGLTPQSSTAAGLLASLLAQLCTAVNVPWHTLHPSLAPYAPQSLLHLPFSKLVVLFPLALQFAVAAKRRVVLFLSHLDRLKPDDNGANLLWLPMPLPAGVRMVLSTMSVEFPSLMVSNPVSEPSLSSAQAVRQAVDMLVSDPGCLLSVSLLPFAAAEILFAACLETNALSAEAISLLRAACAQSPCTPAKIALLARGWPWFSTALSLPGLLILPASADSRCISTDRLANILFDVLDCEFSHFSVLAALVIVAPGGLHSCELFALLPDGVPALSITSVMHVLFRWATVDGLRLFQWRSKQLGALAAKRYAAQVIHARTTLVDLFLATPATGAKKLRASSEKASFSRRKLMALPMLLLASGRFEDLGKFCLADSQFLGAKLCICGQASLLADFTPLQDFAASNPQDTVLSDLWLLREVLVLSLQAVASAPEQLLGQLAGRLPDLAVSRSLLLKRLHKQIQIMFHQDAQVLLAGQSFLCKN